MYCMLYTGSLLVYYVPDNVYLSCPEQILYKLFCRWNKQKI